jgi:hypothetical protein
MNTIRKCAPARNDDLLTLSTLRAANAEAVLSTLPKRMLLTPHSIKQLTWQTDMTLKQIETALDDLARAGRINYEVKSSARYVRRIDAESEAHQ